MNKNEIGYEFEVSHNLCKILFFSSIYTTIPIYYVHDVIDWYLVVKTVLIQ